MITEKHIEGLLPEETVSDYDAKRKTGIGLIEILSSNHWTDYNIHDPGITILEHLCYALTDIDYRSHHGMADLLALPPDEPEAHEQTLFTPRQILHCRPVTTNDFRKLLIDIPGVRNAWLAPKSGGKIPLYLDRFKKRLTTDENEKDVELLELKGFWDVRYELEDKITGLANLKKTIIRTLHENRNLCEDFDRIEKIETQQVLLCADFIVSPEVDIEELSARILLAVEDFISPMIPFYSHTELLERGMTVDEVFEGPRLTHGFILDEDLAAAGLLEELHVSDLIRIFHDIPEIQAIPNTLLTLMEGDNTIDAGQDWVLPLDPQKATRLDVARSRLTFIKKRVPYLAAREKVIQRLKELRAAKRPTRLPPNEQDIPIKPGSYRNAAHYISIQNDFPLNYGIGKVGLPPTATTSRLGKAKQLKAYLLLFEQLLANHLVQIDRLRETFSLGEADCLLQVQLPEDVELLDQILVTDKKAYLKKLKELTENVVDFLRRRNLFLDHLLARFGESFIDYVQISQSLSQGESTDRRLIADKIRFLRSLAYDSNDPVNNPGLNEIRFSAFDILNPPIELRNFSGLERRLRTLLDIPLDADFSLQIRQHFDFIEESDPQDAAKKLFRPFLKSATGEKLLTSDFAFESKTQEEAKLVISDMIASGRYLSNYVVKKVQNNKFVVHLKRDGQHLLASSVAQDTRKKANRRIADIQSFIFGFPPEERVYVLEHLLLRPRAKDAKLLPACEEHVKDPDTAHADPYSFRITVVLPYWPRRFRNMQFRRYLERTIRESAPAHVYTKICWVDESQMQDFESSWLDWRTALASNADGLSGKQNALIEKWLTLNSFYPQSTLSGCEFGEEDEVAILDNLRLGTYKKQ